MLISQCDKWHIWFKSSIGGHGLIKHSETRFREEAFIFLMAKGLKCVLQRTWFFFWIWRWLCWTHSYKDISNKKLLNQMINKYSMNDRSARSDCRQIQYYCLYYDNTIYLVLQFTANKHYSGGDHTANKLCLFQFTRICLCLDTWTFW